MASKPKIIRVALLAAALFLITPLASFAQAASPAASAHQSPAASAQSATKATPASASPAKQPAASAAASVAAPASVAGVATPVGANAPVEKPEGTSIFAYLLIILAGLWLIGALAGIGRLLARPNRGPFAAPLPPVEQDRRFLTFLMPFAALISVAIIVCAWGLLFLFLDGQSKLYPLAVDLLIICMVMGIATFLALRAGAPDRVAIE